MSGKRVRDDVRESSGDDDSEVEDVTEFPKRFSRRMTASFYLLPFTMEANGAKYYDLVCEMEWMFRQ